MDILKIIKTIEELKAMDTIEFSKLVKSRVRRSILRKFDVIDKFVARCRKSDAEKKQIKTQYRDMIVVPKMVGMKIQIYNGHTFVPVDITGEMLGHYFGEFSLTRNKVNHGKAGVGATKGSKSKSKK